MKILDIHNIKKVGIVAKVNAEFIQNLNVISEILNKFNIEILLENSCAKAVNKNGYDLNSLALQSDFIICLGGDGTIISVCRKSAEISPFILGIHAGRLGFLTEITMQDCEWFFDEFFKGNFIVEEPHMLDVRLNKNGKITHKVAFNDAVIMRPKPASIANVEAFLNKKYFNTYFGDGIIASTPIGSTAYNMSTGGAIIYPLSNVFSLTPICSHSLTQRPIIMPKNLTVELKAYKDEVLVIDGQDTFKMKDYESVCVGLSDKKAKLIRHVSRDYFQILKEKLHWGHND
ncbi:NAD(+) kinase [Campylobacter sp. RM9344]|uniref:NAD kinase n=1 Tax=Campylobacter californiensis TaxID=1032243 RepID=A0AAW3ZUB0_9BACT|nr:MULTISPECIES: NAD(+) kinase [unclassified Campylobacter]MBE2984739.1 NAD(+) kinase [Campylobacter sp. RM6883]MBE2986929.1 NAD(+) kinase [Campylobacter sp. RM12919]MBE2987783.1 NAD(+) kinase [Campylobacter sp. RM12920]MBE2994655.1 NAD(+) kinase [Campylobacter sp. RM6913]MBE3029181.1 NAD(+) kinase [Campylobacter sp. RM9344]